MATTGSSETRVQAFVHALEQGRIAPLMRGLLVAALLAGLALMYLGWQFRGLSIPEAMDQAQIARQIATGQGWTTELIRPLAIWQIKSNLGTAPQGAMPDTFNAPLPPLVNALAIKLAGPKISFGPNEYIMPVERFIVALSMVCFLLSTVVQFFLLRRLFDQRLAIWAIALTLVSNMCWQFTLSGLPQMLMLLLFNLALYALTRAVEFNVALAAIADGNAPAEGTSLGGQRAAVLLWLAVVGALFGLLTLSHGLAIWFFLGLLVFAGFYFRQRGPVLLVLLAAFAVVYAPWLVRTYHVSGSPFGVAIYGTFEQIGIGTVDRMRSADGPQIDGIEPRFFRPKIEEGIIDEIEHLPGDFGGGVVALAFFVGLLHVFRRRETGAMRLAIFLMWVVAVIGMAATRVYGSAPGGVDPDQLQMLFLPVMTGYGLAFLLVLFSRREDGSGVLARIILFTVLLLLTALPMIFTLLPNRNRPPVQYPPYFQPAIHKLSAWTNSDEIIGSDMPWAVAWYADRKSLWIPLHLHDFMGMSDNGELNGPLAGIFLTQISRDTPFLSSLYRGDYQDYQSLIFGRTDLPLFPFHEETLPMGDLSYSFASDTKRWEKPAPK